MAHILVSTTGYCFCNCADKCVVMHKSGTMSSCTSQDLKEAGHRPVPVSDVESNDAVRSFTCIDGDEKTLTIRLKRK